MSREYTEAEVREMFLCGIKQIVFYWSGTANEEIEKLNGVAFSILALLDGCHVGQPGYKVIPIMAEGNKEYYIENDENWYPENCDIAGFLHEEFYK